MQLNIAQGKVRCAECHATFDAFAHFILDPDYLPSTNPQNFIHYSLQHDTKDIQTNPFDLTAHASKNASIIESNGLKRSDDANDRYSNPDNDLRGDWKSSDLSVGPAIEKNIYEII